MAPIVASKATSKHVKASLPAQQPDKVASPKTDAMTTPMVEATPKRAKTATGCMKSLVPPSVSQASPVEVQKEIECTYHDLDKLQNFGVNAADITKLKSAGFCTVLSLIQATKKELCQVKGISEAKVDKVLEAATKIEIATHFITGNQLLKKRASILRISTGSIELDKLIGGGIESMSITEIFGENRTGKTQICHTLSVTAQLPVGLNGGNGKVCLIDTEGTFRPERVGSIASRFGLEPAAVLDNIAYARAYTHEHLNHLLTIAAAKMIEDHYALLIVDSIMTLFRVDFTGRGELAERQQVLNKTLSRLIKIAEQFNIAIVYTNHVMSDPGGGMTFVANLSKPIGGHVLGHASTTRLSLRKGKGDQRVCKVYDSPCLPESECIFQVSDSGIIDATD